MEIITQDPPHTLLLSNDSQYITGLARDLVVVKLVHWILRLPEQQPVTFLLVGKFKGESQTSRLDSGEDDGSLSTHLRELVVLIGDKDLDGPHGKNAWNELLSVDDLMTIPIINHLSGLDGCQRIDVVSLVACNATKDRSAGQKTVFHYNVEALASMIKDIVIAPKSSHSVERIETKTGGASMDHAILAGTRSIKLVVSEYFQQARVVEKITQSDPVIHRAVSGEEGRPLSTEAIELMIRVERNALAQHANRSRLRIIVLEKMSQQSRFRQGVA